MDDDTRQKLDAYRRRLERIEAHALYSADDVISVDKTHVWRTAVMAAVLFVLAYDALEGRTFRQDMLAFQGRMLVGLNDLGQRVSSLEATTRAHSEALRDMRFSAPRDVREPRLDADKQDARPRVP